MDGLRVNFSEKEATAANQEPLPTGKYLCHITDASIEECGPNSKNPGKQYLKFEFTVDDSNEKYKGRKCWTNAMLFDGALYTISKMLKALGMSVEPGEMIVPLPDWWIGKQLIVGGTKVGETKDKVDPTKTYDPKFEPKNFFPATADAAKKVESLLP